MIKFIALLYFLCSLLPAQFVDFSVNTQTYYGNFMPANCMAVWVTDTNNNYIKTVSIAANLLAPGGYRMSLNKWIAMSGWDSTDAVTSATYSIHGTRSAAWDCRDKYGSVVPDGSYKLYIEMTENNSQTNALWAGPWTAIRFTKGTTDSVMPADYWFTDQWNLNRYFGTSQKVFANMKVVYWAPNPGTVQFQSAYYSAGENSGSVRATITRTRGKTGGISVTCVTRNGTALAGLDFTGDSAAINFADNDYTPKTVTIILTNDTLTEGNQTFSLVLKSPAGGAALGVVDTSEVTILDDDGGLSTQGLVGLWTFNEGGGTLAHDSSGYGNHAALSGTDWFPGKIGYGLNFDGGTAQADLGTGVSLRIGGPVSVAAWIYPRVNNIAQTFLSAASRYNLWLQTDKQLRFADTQGDYVDSPADVLKLDQWNHVAAVFSGDSGAALSLSNALLYVNGVSVGNHVAGIWKGNKSATNSVVLGQAGFNGMLDEVCIYNRALSYAEVQAMYSDTIAGTRLSPSALPPDLSIGVFPNPCQGPVLLTFPEISGMASLTIFDLAGKKVRIWENIREKRLAWDPGNLSHGIYLVQFKLGTRTLLKRFLFVG